MHGFGSEEEKRRERESQRARERLTEREAEEVEPERVNKGEMELGDEHRAHRMVNHNNGFIITKLK